MSWTHGNIPGAFAGGGLALSGGTLTGPVLFPDGSASAPSISFSSDTDTGIFWGSSGIIAFSNNGTQIWRFTTTQFNNLSSGGIFTNVLELRGSSDRLFLKNAAATDAGLIIIGSAATTSFPALKRVTTTIEARLADDSNVASFVSNGSLQNEGRLSSTASIDLSSTSKQTLYTVPAGKTCYITRVVVRDPSAAITLATVTIGFNAGADDVVSAVALTALSGATKYQLLLPAAGAEEGAAAAVLGLDTTVQEGAADTVTVDVYGYLV